MTQTFARLSILAVLIAAAPARAQLSLQGITINGDPAILDTADPIRLNLRTGSVRGQSVVPRPSVWGPTCQPGLTPATPGVDRPAYIKLDGKWYQVGAVAEAEIYPTLILIDGAPVRNCSRPGGAAQTISQSLLVTNNGGESIWLLDGSMLNYIAGVGGRVLEATSSSGDLTCANAITVDPIATADLLQDGFEPSTRAPRVEVDRMRVRLCDGTSTGCVEFEL